MEINKALLLDDRGRPFTQSLFLELGYSDQALYTLKEQDHEYKGKVYPSIKRLYLEMEDPTEYDFSSKYFMNWKHWQKCCENRDIRKHIDEWRFELELKLRARAVKHMLSAANAGNYQACKWLSDRGWHERGAGRPSKAEIQKEKEIQSRIEGEYSGDVIRLFGSK